MDADFPPLEDDRCIEMHKALHKSRRKYAYKELKDGTIYIHFPRINPIEFICQCLYNLGLRHNNEDEEEYEDAED